MTELQIHEYLVLTTFVFAAMTFVLLFRITAPYGRHLRSGWGPTVAARLGWVVMESPSVFLFAIVFYLGEHSRAAVPLMLLALWQFHYINRSFVYPIRMKASGRRIPIAIVGMAILFNCINTYTNARWISQFGDYPDSWVSTAPFVLGVLCFFAGWAINQQADAILMRLRLPGKSDYKIPNGGLYRWISCPNYFGEMLEWLGWALATWSLAGSAFAIFTIANLLPRAISHHRWYRKEFADYPPTRRAVVPFLI